MIRIFQKIIILFSLWHSLLFADMQIKITSGVNTAHPIAVIPFTWIPHQHNQNKYNILIEENIDIASVISADLCNSGKFNTFTASGLLRQPTKISDIIPVFWEKIGINIIVLGTVNISDDNNYIISYQLIDTSNKTALIILENQFLIEKKWLRYIAHTISNEIFEKLTGIKGIFCTRIAYIIQYNNNNQYPYELCISDYDGFNRISICRSSAPLMSPAWSPDGKKIAYVTFASGHAELVIQTLNTGIIYKIINFPKHNGAPAFSPDGTKLAFALSKTGSLNLYIMNLISEEIQQLTNNRFNNTEPNWFPDSKNLAYTSDQGGFPQVYKININTTTANKPKRLSWLKTSNQSPNVSSNGKFIIMINRSLGKQNVAKLDLEDEQTKILTNTFLDDTPSIAPNDTMLVYSTIKKLKSVLELISIDGHFKTNFEIEGNIRFPSWSPY